MAHITDCPTIVVHAGKCYKALIDSGAAISLLRYSTYKKIEDCYKTPIQPTTAKLNTADGSPMMALGSTALHLQIAEFKFTHNFIICDQLPETELILASIYRNFHYLMLVTRTKSVIYIGLLVSYYQGYYCLLTIQVLPLWSSSHNKGAHYSCISLLTSGLWLCGVSYALCLLPSLLRCCGHLLSCVSLPSNLLDCSSACLKFWVLQPLLYSAYLQCTFG